MFERIQNTFYTEISYHFQNPLEILHVLFDGVSKNYYNHVPNRTLGICTWFHSSLIQVLFYPLEIQLHILDCCPKFTSRLKCLIRHKSKKHMSDCSFAKIIHSWGNHFGKRTAWSLIYFWIYAHLNILACLKFSLSVSIILFTLSKQPNLRILNPQYFVYLLDQQ